MQILTPSTKKLRTQSEIAIEESKQVPSLSTVILDAIENENMETDDRKCYHGHMAAQSILRDIDQLNKRGNAKEEVLPCQSDLETRRKMAELDKELCRQRKIKEDMTVVSWGYHIKSDKWKLQLSQLQKPISDTFKYFLQCLCNLEATDRKYFLQCLKLGLNERSVDLLQPLYDKYERYHSEAESEERDMNLQILDSELMYGSLGVEHFFREMAILYENISTLQENAGLRSESLNTLLYTLSRNHGISADGWYGGRNNGWRCSKCPRGMAESSFERGRKQRKEYPIQSICNQSTRFRKVNSSEHHIWPEFSSQQWQMYSWSLHATFEGGCRTEENSQM